MQAIPREWKIKITNNNDEEESEETEDIKLIDKMLEQKKPTKVVYDILIKSKSILPTETIDRWQKELECTCTGDKESCCKQTCPLTFPGH